jgi:hypothetical protein
MVDCRCQTCGVLFKSTKRKTKYCSRTCVPYGSHLKGKKQSAEHIRQRTEVIRKVVKTPEWRKAHKNAWDRLKEPESNPAWKGGKSKDNDGYIYIKAHEHPYRNARNYVFEHRLIMEKHLGRFLQPWEVLHHKNGIVDDNRIENLTLTNHPEHARIHNNLGKYNTRRYFGGGKV